MGEHRQLELRPYQQEATGAVFERWNEDRATLLVMATGTGKTIVFSAITQKLVEKGKRVLILAHRGELLDQASDKLYKMTGLETALEKAESTCLEEEKPVVVGSVQTLQSWKRLERFDPAYFDYIIVDEAHHAVSDSYLRVLDYFSMAKVLGVTATADRSDQKNLGQVFDSLAYEYGMAKAIHDGYLAPLKAKTIPLTVDITNVAVTAGDYNAGQLGYALEPYLSEIADVMAEECKGKKTMVFLPLVSTSQEFCMLLRDKGMKAVEVNGESKDRKEILQDFESGKYDIICNSMLLTEGYDCPAVDCIVCLRPTKSRGLYQQIIGRGTRLSPETGKTHLLILDFLWLTEKHELCRPANLICDKAEIAERMTKELAESGEEYDLDELEEKAVKDVRAEREAALAAELARQKKKKSKLVDPLQFELSIADSDLMDYEPVWQWEILPATNNQVSALEKFGLSVSADTTCKGKAKIMIDKCIKRAQSGMSTPKQIRFLENKGFQHVGEWTMKQASSMITNISHHGWRVPSYINPLTYDPNRKEEDAWTC